jgi:hypothetical protein
MACAVHGTTTLRACQKCNDFQAPALYAGPFRRNLIYHVMPVKGSGVWQMNLDQLKQRLHIFDGKKVIAIVTEASCDPPEKVMDYLAGSGIDWIVKPNDARFRETATWMQLWESVHSTDPADITFYGHAKGVTKPVNRAVTTHRWAGIHYHTQLDYLPLVETQLRQYPITGSLKKLGAGFEGSDSAWHYSGTFYWVRNDYVFARSLHRYVDRTWWGNESWPGLHWRADQAGTLFMEAPGAELNLYHMSVLERVERQLDEWKAVNRRFLSPIGSQTVSSTPTS